MRAGILPYLQQLASVERVERVIFRRATPYP